MVYSIETAHEFQELSRIAPHKICLINFYANSSGPCPVIKPHLIELERKYNVQEEKLVILQVNADQLRPIAEHYQVTELPSCIFFKGKDRTAVKSLFSPDALKLVLKQLFGF